MFKFKIKYILLFIVVFLIGLNNSVTNKDGGKQISDHSVIFYNCTARVGSLHSLSEMCKNELIYYGNTVRRPFTLFVRNEWEPVLVASCTKLESKQDIYCGFYSYEKLVEPMSILQPIMVDYRDCRTWAMEQRVRTEHGVVLDLKNGRVEYKFVAHGALYRSSNNVQCQGTSVHINNVTIDNLLEFRTISIEVSTGWYEINWDKQLIRARNTIREWKFNKGRGDNNYYVQTGTFTLGWSRKNKHKSELKAVSHIELEFQFGNWISEKEGLAFQIGKEGQINRRLVNSTQIENVFIAELYHPLDPKPERNLTLELQMTKDFQNFVVQRERKTRLYLENKFKCMNVQQSKQKVQWQNSIFIEKHGTMILEQRCTEKVAQLPTNLTYCYPNRVQVFHENKALFLNKENMVLTTSTNFTVNCSNLMYYPFRTRSNQIVWYNTRGKLELLDKMDIILDFHEHYLTGIGLREELEEIRQAQESEVLSFISCTGENCPPMSNFMTEVMTGVNDGLKGINGLWYEITHFPRVLISITVSTLCTLLILAIIYLVLKYRWEKRLVLDKPMELKDLQEMQTSSH